MATFFFHYSRRYFLYAIVMIIAMLLIALPVYEHLESKIKRLEMEQYHTYLNQTIDHLVKEKNKTTQAIAIALSAPVDLKQAILTRDDKTRFLLKSFSDQLRELAGYDNVWIQLIDKKGVSIGRSWSDKRGDNLSNVRKDVAEVLSHPRRINSFSVGKFALTFKSIVPLFDNDGDLIGLVDVISQVDSIDDSLFENEGVHSVVLVDKSFRKQLSNAHTRKFIQDYYVANMDARIEDMERLDRLGIDNVYNNPGVIVDENQLITIKRLRDIYGNHMASWVSIKPLSNFTFNGLENLRQWSLTIVISFALFLILIAALLYFKRQADFEKRFFYQVFENATEIIYVVDRNKIIQANRQFFSYFDELDSLDNFHDEYNCVADLFVRERGFLSPYVNGQYWYDYVREHPEKQHYAKISFKGNIRVFNVKATAIQNPFDKVELVSILMTNITEEIHYKEQLEHLIMHDELTGIFNRHYFNENLSAEIKRAERYHKSLAMISFDIDFFKKINDDFGHDVGDKVLISVSQTVLKSLRETDRFCRLGGEEFCIIMPETNLEQASMIAERLRMAVSEIPESVVPRKITISLGVSEFNQWDSDKSFYKRADMAMYQAKQQGRNAVMTIEN